MTDRGRRARWTAAATLSPLAAALFAGTTAWATSHSPTITAASTATESNAAQGADPASSDAVSSELQQTLDDETARVSALEKKVAELRAQTAALKAGTTGRAATGTKTAKGSPARSGTSQARTTTRSTTPTTPRRTTTTTRTTTTKAPAVHTTTGGS